MVDLPIPLRPMITMNEIVSAIQVTRMTIYRWMDKDKFPRPVNLGDNVMRFWLDEVQEWLKQREQQSGAPLPKAKLKWSDAKRT